MARYTMTPVAGAVGVARPSTGVVSERGPAVARDVAGGRARSSSTSKPSCVTCEDARAGCERTCAQYGKQAMFRCTTLKSGCAGTRRCECDPGRSLSGEMG
jgi:hypothetical protein